MTDKHSQAPVVEWTADDARRLRRVGFIAVSDVMAILENQRARILEIAEAYGATNVRVFGTGADGDDDLDLDLLVDMDPDRSLFDLVDLGMELGELLGRRVEVIAAASLSPRLHASVLADARPL